LFSSEGTLASFRFRLDRRETGSLTYLSFRGQAGGYAALPTPSG
jgi:hypothetical protein